MNPTRDIITDLLPLYFSGEASADTRALVEEYFVQDPEFERMARRMAESLKALQIAPTDDDEELEKRTLLRTRSELRTKNISLGVVVTALLAIVLLVTAEKASPSIKSDVYPVAVLACVAVAALVAKHARKTGR